METWYWIPTWEGFYEVSSLGRVRSVDRDVKGRWGLTRYRGRVLRPTWSSGYAVVNLVETGRGRRQQYYIHDLVLLALRGPKPVGLEVCHGSLGALNNGIKNLRYDTRKENAADRKRFGGVK